MHTSIIRTAAIYILLYLVITYFSLSQVKAGNVVYSLQQHQDSMNTSSDDGPTPDSDNLQVFKVIVQTTEPMPLDQLFYVHSNGGSQILSMFNHYADQYFTHYRYISFELTNYDSFNVYYETMLKQNSGSPNDISTHLTNEMDRFVSPLFTSQSSAGIRQQSVEAITFPSQCHFIPNTGSAENDRLLLEEFDTSNHIHDTTNNNSARGDGTSLVRAYLCGDPNCFKCNSLAPCSRDQDCMFLSECVKNTNVCSMLSLSNSSPYPHSRGYIIHFYSLVSMILHRIHTSCYLMIRGLSYPLTHLISTLQMYYQYYSSHYFTPTTPATPTTTIDQSTYPILQKIYDGVPGALDTVLDGMWEFWVHGGYLLCTIITIITYHVYFAAIPVVHS